MEVKPTEKLAEGWEWRLVTVDDGYEKWESWRACPIERTRLIAVKNIVGHFSGVSTPEHWVALSEHMHHGPFTVYVVREEPSPNE